jgi:GH18 family chitinase
LRADTGEKVVLCYFANWAGIREGDGHFVPENIQVNYITFIIF